MKKARARAEIDLYKQNNYEKSSYNLMSQPRAPYAARAMNAEKGYAS